MHPWSQRWAEPNRSAVLIMHQKTSMKSWVFSWLKFGWWLWKYSTLVSFTRLESQLNASWWLLVNTLYKGVISCHFKVEDPLGVAWDVVPLRGEASIGSGEWHHCFSLGECPGFGGKEVPGVDPGGKGGAPWGMLKKWDIGVCPSKMW